MARTTRKTARTTKARASRKAKPQTEYVDTEGLELDEPVEGATPAQQAKIDKANVARLKRKQAKEARDLAKLYHGAPIPATKVFKRRMAEFKNCVAVAWMIVNEQAGTYTYANSYGQTGDGMPRSSYKPEQYTFKINEKTLAKKMDTYAEVEDRAEWPEWITPALPAKRKARK